MARALTAWFRAASWLRASDEFWPSRRRPGRETRWTCSAPAPTCAWPTNLALAAACRCHRLTVTGVYS